MLGRCVGGESGSSKRRSKGNLGKKFARNFKFSSEIEMEFLDSNILIPQLPKEKNHFNSPVFIRDTNVLG